MIIHSVKITAWALQLHQHPPKNSSSMPTHPQGVSSSLKADESRPPDREVPVEQDSVKPTVNQPSCE